MRWAKVVLSVCAVKLNPMKQAVGVLAYGSLMESSGEELRPARVDSGKVTNGRSSWHLTF